MQKAYMNSIEFENTIRGIYYELKQIAENPEWDEEDVDGNWLDYQYQFIKDYIHRKLKERSWVAMIEDIVAADLIASALNTILEMTEISFKEACIECMSFLEDNFNL